MMKRLILVVAITPFLIAATCQHQDEIDIVGQTLMSMGVVYNSTMNAFGQAFQLGLLTKEQVEKVADIATKFRASYNIALDIYVVWLNTRNAQDKDRLMVALNEASTLLSKLRTYANELGVLK